MEDLKKISKLQADIEYRFEDSKLLEQALTHSSYANEKRLGKLYSNERLEFLGDAVLELTSSEFLYTAFPCLPEGELTKKRASLVCEPTLAQNARQFGLGEYLLLGHGEAKTGGRDRDSIVSDALEALIGAIYLDGGINAAKCFINKFVLNDIENKQVFRDSKTLLQEILQEQELEFGYRLVREAGPDHDKNFTVEVFVGNKVLGTGTGHTKKAAEQTAAGEAVWTLRKK
ncbi:MAG: ribonuclease III [Lachnospiraceae bacterium]